MMSPSDDRRSAVTVALLLSTLLFGCAINLTSPKLGHIRSSGINSDCPAEPFSFIEKAAEMGQRDFPVRDLAMMVAGKIALQWAIECKAVDIVTSCVINYKIQDNSPRVIYLLDVFNHDATEFGTNINVQFPIGSDSVELIRGYVMPPAKLSWLTAPLARAVVTGQSVLGIARVADIQREWHYDRGVSSFREAKEPVTLRLFFGYMLAQQLPPGESVFDKASEVYQIPRWRQSISQQWLCSPLINIAKLRFP